METRRLGRTEHLSTIFILGGAAFGKIDQADADRAFHLAMDHGVNHIDIAPSYGRGVAETRIGNAMRGYRDRFFLACKTTKRAAEDAWAELNESLERLQVDAFDLYQMHSVNDMENLEQALGPGGAVETFLRARDEGITKYLGITGHGLLAPQVHKAAIERFGFDTVLNPLNFVLWANEGYRRDYEAFRQEAKARDVGLLAIKAWAKAPWGEDARAYGTWYRPFDDLGHLEDCLRWALSQEGLTGLAGPSDVRLWPIILDAAERFRPMAADEQAALVATADQYELIFEAPAH